MRKSGQSPKHKKAREEKSEPPKKPDDSSAQSLKTSPAQSPEKKKASRNARKKANRKARKKAEALKQAEEQPSVSTKRKFNQNPSGGSAPEASRSSGSIDDRAQDLDDDLRGGALVRARNAGLLDYTNYLEELLALPVQGRFGLKIKDFKRPDTAPYIHNQGKHATAFTLVRAIFDRNLKLFEEASLNDPQASRKIKQQIIKFSSLLSVISQTLPMDDAHKQELSLTERYIKRISDEYQAKRSLKTMLKDTKAFTEKHKGLFNETMRSDLNALLIDTRKADRSSFVKKFLLATSAHPLSRAKDEELSGAIQAIKLDQIADGSLSDAVQEIIQIGNVYGLSYLKRQQDLVENTYAYNAMQIKDFCTHLSVIMIKYYNRLLETTFNTTKATDKQNKAAKIEKPMAENAAITFLHKLPCLDEAELDASARESRTNYETLRGASSSSTVSGGLTPKQIEWDKKTIEAIYTLLDYDAIFEDKKSVSPEIKEAKSSSKKSINPTRKRSEEDDSNDPGDDSDTPDSESSSQNDHDDGTSDPDTSDSIEAPASSVSSDTPTSPGKRDNKESTLIRVVARHLYIVFTAFPELAAQYGCAIHGEKVEPYYDILQEKITQPFIEMLLENGWPKFSEQPRTAEHINKEIHTAFKKLVASNPNETISKAMVASKSSDDESIDANMSAGAEASVGGGGSKESTGNLSVNSSTLLSRGAQRNVTKPPSEKNGTKLQNTP